MILKDEIIKIFLVVDKMGAISTLRKVVLKLKNYIDMKDKNKLEVLLKEVMIKIQGCKKC